MWFGGGKGTHGCGQKSQSGQAKGHHFVRESVREIRRAEKVPMRHGETILPVGRRIKRYSYNGGYPNCNQKKETSSKMKKDLKPRKGSG